MGKRRPGSVRLLLVFILSIVLFINLVGNPEFRKAWGPSTVTREGAKVQRSNHTTGSAPLEPTDRPEQTKQEEDLQSRTSTTSTLLVLPNADATNLNPRRTKMADGCYHVFLDCGSNVGVHGRFLFEPQKYPKSTFASIFDEQFGSNRTKQNICVFAFEPNPLHSVKQSMTQEKYRIMGWRYQYMPFGVSDGDGNLTFHRSMDTNNLQNEEWGFSSFNGGQNGTEAVVVPLVDLAQWVLTEVSDRIVPEKSEYNLGPPRVIMKMDVEGSEYRTLLRLYKTRAYKVFNAIIGEHHPWTLPQEIDGRQFHSKKSLRRYFGELKSLLEEDGGPGFREFDDEQYLHDGMAYPDPDDSSMLQGISDFQQVSRNSSLSLNDNVLSVEPRRAKLADGCYHVFLDCGSNVGVHGRFLFEPQKYPKSTFATIFDEQFGSNRTKQNICVFAFEPNPLHSVKQSMTQEKYRIMGWRYQYMPFGVSDSDGNLTFHRNLESSNGAKNEEWGFSSFNAGQNVTETVVVPLVDLAQWVLQEVSDRIIPEKSEYNLGPPRVIMKMDVEGSEYRTLLRLYKTRAYKVFNAIMGEQHDWALPQEIDGRQFHSKRALRRYFGELKSLLEEDGGPGFREFDDEQYLHDGMAYPDPDDPTTW